MKKPIISVLMPVYNGEKYLKESIESILNQTFKDFELVIVNDGSTDGSLKIMKSYQKKDKRIKIINTRNNLGVIGALNTGLKKIKTKYVASFNQDDISHPKRLEIEFDYLEKNPHIFLVGSSAVYIDEQGKEIRRFRKYDDYKLLAWRLRKSCSIVYPSIMFRNKGVVFDDHYEYNLYYKLLKRGENLTNLPQFLVKYRVHNNAMSTYDKKNQDLLFEEVVEKFNGLKNEINFLQKIYFSLKVLFHHIKTIKEKKILFGK
ncbi:MAG: glycosyltransferase [Nanoarchaeota archaeon]|nr:glycosyltransferase [Nanoarchaeota archaeon]